MSARRKLILPETRLTLPRKGCRLSAVAEAAHDLKIRAFCSVIMDIDRALAVRPGRRGLCYHMEGDRRLDIKKDEFEAVERFIIECTKKGYLPWDLCAEDESRAWTIDEYDWLDSETADFIASPAFIDAEARRRVSDILSADSLIDQLREAHRTYEAYGFWEAQPRYYIAGIAVEKIDIFNVWEEVADEFHIPICNIKGGWVLSSRVSLIRRCQEAERHGKIPVLLVAGDLDPYGLRITSAYRKGIEDMRGAISRDGDVIDWDPVNLIIRRVGLDKDFVDRHVPNGWIENLVTGYGGDLGDKNHAKHNNKDIQAYIDEYGTRKCEANVLVLVPDAARQLLRSVILEYFDEAAEQERQRKNAVARERLRLAITEAIPEALAAFRERLDEIGDGEVDDG